jgi:hypothetical protein
VSATVKTAFTSTSGFRPEPTEAQRALFTNAAARLIPVVHLPNVTLTDFDVARACGVFDLPTLNETVDDVVIYASVQNIDGVGKILAEAGPCGFRSAASGLLTTVGVMEFDAADIDRLAANGTLQDVITHEMLHVLGIGTLWSDRRLLQAEGNVRRHIPRSGRPGGCFDSGGASVCGLEFPSRTTAFPGRLTHTGAKRRFSPS